MFDLMKEITYKKEAEFLSPYACFSQNTAGREKEEESCPMRTEFQRDRDRIMHSKAFRRLKNKTQVFLAPKGDHYRTRMTHTLDVMQIARSIARVLCLNEDLTEAIALGHDLGHTPFGHAGERTLNRLSDGRFHHNEQSIRVCEVIEKDGRGLNLTREVKDGILNHRSGGSPSTLEGKVVMFADKIAYVNHDIDDAIRAGVLDPADLPKAYTAVMGDTATQRINNAILSIYNESKDKPFVKMDDKMADAMSNLRKFMFQNVYHEKSGNTENRRADRLLTILFDRFFAEPSQMPSFFVSLLDKYDKTTVVCDYLASMSDTYAISLFNDLFVPQRWVVL